MTKSKKHYVNIFYGNGSKKVKVEVPIAEDEWLPTRSTVTLFDSEVGLVDIWLVNFYQHFGYDSKDFTLKYVDDKLYDHEPTDDDIMSDMGRLGLSRNDCVDIQRMKMLAYDKDDLIGMHKKLQPKVEQQET